MFPISRDPPEGGTLWFRDHLGRKNGLFPISRDPPEGGTEFTPIRFVLYESPDVSNF